MAAKEFSNESEISQFKTFGQLMHFFRLRLGFSLKELAYHCHVSPSYLLDIEKGNRYPPSNDLLYRLMGVLLLNNEERDIFERMAYLGRAAIDDKELVEYLCVAAPSSIAFIKMAKELNLPDEYFQRLITTLNIEK